jgi:hypothetical protein
MAEKRTRRRLTAGCAPAPSIAAPRAAVPPAAAPAAPASPRPVRRCARRAATPRSASPPARRPCRRAPGRSAAPPPPGTGTARRSPWTWPGTAMARGQPAAALVPGGGLARGVGVSLRHRPPPPAGGTPPPPLRRHRADDVPPAVHVKALDDHPLRRAPALPEAAPGLGPGHRFLPPARAVGGGAKPAQAEQAAFRPAASPSQGQDRPGGRGQGRRRARGWRPPRAGRPRCRCR